ncbi:MAG: ferredoxin family protein [Lentisphaeria bacterium]|nr:ferredoxin family protein [Lentisphaeria bacterium]NQZ69545.1 ferredoxin family protein [Lentisphaeria bacterium]
MTYIVTEPCKGCRYTDCVEVCPVDCFHIDDDMLLIDPDECIDCAACVPVCPVEAIFFEDDVPDKYQEWIEINIENAAGLPVIDETQDPLKPYPE